MFDFKARIRKLQKEMTVDCVVLAQFNHPEANALYYSGIEEPILVYVTKDTSVAFAKGEGNIGHFDELLPFKDAKGFYKSFFRKNKVKTVGLDFSSEANRVGFKLLEKPEKVRVLNYSDKLSELRAVKSKEELRFLRKAQDITKKCVAQAERNGFQGKTENELAGFLEFSSRKMGVALDSFPPIVATGVKTATPHSSPSNDVVKDLVLIDCGATAAHYHGDFTTTEYWGSDKQIKDAIEAVWEAKKASEKNAKVGVKGKVLSDISQKVIEEYGFGEYSFRKAGLALGHSVGLEVHDGFRLEQVTLKKRMAFTIEPGIYLPKKFGVRFEDIVFL